VIESYLDSLAAELRVPRRTRARILAETRDHLLEDVASGQTEEAAVVAFGDAGDVAARFHEQLASSSARRASAQTVLLALVFGIGMTAAAFGPQASFPFGIVVFIGAQLAAVAAAIAFVRWLRYRSAPQVPVTRLADLYRANALTVGAVAVVALAEIASGPPGLAIGGGVMLATALAVGARVHAAAARARVLTLASPQEDALDDLVAVLPQVGSVAGRIPVRRNPWRVCLLFAAVCGLALAAWHGIVEASGPITFANFARALLAGFLIASIETTAVIACFAAFGRLLGIRR
jgi:uncharacterized membrane protein